MTSVLLPRLWRPPKTPSPLSGSIPSTVHCLSSGTALRTSYKVWISILVPSGVLKENDSAPLLGDSPLPLAPGSPPPPSFLSSLNGEVVEEKKPSPPSALQLSSVRLITLTLHFFFSLYPSL